MHVVPGQDGLFIECTANLKSVWSPSIELAWLSKAQLVTKYIINVRKIRFCSNNGGDF